MEIELIARIRGLATEGRSPEEIRKDAEMWIGNGFCPYYDGEITVEIAGHDHGKKSTCVVQDWVASLGLRHQGCLMSAIRGCDGVPKDDPSKALIRCVRSVLLNSFDRNPSSFIEFVEDEELKNRMVAVLKNSDHYPVHFFTHLMHAAEIIGYKHPDEEVAKRWRWFYHKACHCLHLFPETGYDLDQRLGADETKFAANDKIG